MESISRLFGSPPPQARGIGIGTTDGVTEQAAPPDDHERPDRILGEIVVDPEPAVTDIWARPEIHGRGVRSSLALFS